MEGARRKGRADGGGKLPDAVQGLQQEEECEVTMRNA